MVIASPIGSTSTISNLRRMAGRTYILATIAVFSLGYGVAGFLSSSGRGESSSSITGVGDKAEATIRRGLSGTFGRPVGNRIASVELRGAAAVASADDWPNLPAVHENTLEKPPPDKPPIDLDEPLYAGDSETSGITETGLDPVQIGPEVDADDPLPPELSQSSGPAIDIGLSLDADNPEAGMHSTTSIDPIAIGRDIDANEPRRWNIREVSNASIEIGAPLDAGVGWDP